MSSQDMDDLINLINSTTLSPNKAPIKPVAPNPLHNIEANASDTNSDDDDISYLLDVMHKKPPSDINSILPSNKSNNKHNHTSNNTLTPLSAQPPSNNTAANAIHSSLDDLVSLLSPKPKSNSDKAIASPRDLKLDAINKPQLQSKTAAVDAVPQQKSTISLSIRTLTGESMKYEMDPKDTIKSLKLKIFNEHKIWPQHQRLVYGGDNLMNKHSLQMLGIQNEGILYLVLTTICSNTEPPKTIAVQKLNGDIFYISCTSNDSVQTLKRTIFNQEGYEIESQILHFMHYGRLQNEETLAQYNIQNNSMLKLMLRNIRFDNIRDEEEEEEEENDDTQVTLATFSPQHDPQSDNNNNNNKVTDIKQAILPPNISNEPKQANIVPLKPPATEAKAAKVSHDEAIEAKDAIIAPSAPDIAPSQAAEAQIIANTSYKGWNVGDICYRKGAKCVIKMIDFRSDPPSVTLSLFNNAQHEINTEFALISRSLPIVKKQKRAKQIHLFSPNIIRQLMAVNNIKYVGSGLKNLGNSCFMNATLQCMAYTQVLQNYICQKIHSKMCTSRSQNNQVCFMCELHELLAAIINNGGYVCSATRLFNNLQYLSASLTAGRQEDSHEFWTALMKHLQAAVMKPHIAANGGKKLPIAIQETSIIYKIWGGYLRSQILCTSCHKASNTYDSILDLSLEIRGCSSINAALKQFTVEEKLIQDNKYFCAFCKKKQNAIKQLTIFDAPNILILHLKRFEFGTKIDKFVKFDTVLDLTPFMSKYKKMKERKIKITYSLYAVLIHSGKYSNCGHYYCYVRTASNKWYLCNDSIIRSSNVRNVLKQNGYLFFYQRNQTKRYPTY